MTGKTPSNEEMRKKNHVIDQRQQQIDPTGLRRYDPNDSAIRRAQKQAGQDLSEPQSGEAERDRPDTAREKLSEPGRRENAQNDHAGTRHSPDEFDTMNPQKQGLSDVRPSGKPGKP
jgi:hypothetical protein